MLSRIVSCVWRCGGAIVLVLPLGHPALAGGEVALSDEAAASGGVTPGDTPGYPITLSLPGHYRLAGNLHVPAGADGIVVEADGVTVDFDGFVLDGTAGAATGVSSRHDTLALRGGVISGFQYFAIDNRATGRFWTISDMRVVSNGLGVSAGDYARVVGNTIASNQNYGLSCQYCLVEGNVVAMNHDDGVDVKGAAVLGNSISGNRGYGISAFMLAYTLSGYGENTLVKNNGSGHLSADGHFVAQSPQVNGRLVALQPNAE